MTNEFTLIADSGSTKTDWRLIADDGSAQAFQTRGINPCVMEETQIAEILRKELLPQIPLAVSIERLWFYGAGCRGQQAEMMRRILQHKLRMEGNVHVHSDMLGAARALCGNDEGIVCILGTGSNSCLFSEGRIAANVPALGFILGDEGSGAVLGRRLLGDVFKGQLPKDLTDEFLSTYDRSADDAIRHVYRESSPNRYLASFAPFLSAHAQRKEIHDLLVGEFTRFIRRNVMNYNRPDLPVGFVGSVAYHFQNELSEAVRSEGLKLGRVMQAPLDALVVYHMTES